jgi:hypothetical protein
MKKLLVITLMFSVFGFKAFSQGNPFNSPPVNILSPDAASLGKYGAYNVNYYTGTPNISVPIYEINESGIKIPISISYDASGYIPNKNSSQVGQGWNLTAGGAITRVVKGVPDEKHNPNPPEGNEPYTRENKGYIYGILTNSPSTYPTQSYVENLQFLSTTASYDPGYPTVTGTQVNYEYNPDIFSFNFLGHSGTFVMGNDGTVKVSSDRKYKIDVTGMITGIAPNDGFSDLGGLIATKAFAGAINTYVFSTITITSDDGYKFYFGGKLNALEVSFSYPSAQYDRGVIGKSGVINAWYLTKIETSDGEMINFDYGSYSTTDATVLANITNPNVAGSFVNLDASFFDIRLFWRDSKIKFVLQGSSNTGNQDLSISKSLIKMVYLKKIETKLRTISFAYSKRNELSQNLFYTTQPSSSTHFADYVAKNEHYFSSKLDRISIKDNVGVVRPTINGDFPLGSPIINYDFTYDFFGSLSTGYRLFLTRLASINTKYDFEYWRTSELQHPMTSAIDKWGYYNAQSNTTLIGLNGPVYGDPAEFETNFTYTGHWLAKTNNSTYRRNNAI